MRKELELQLRRDYVWNTASSIMASASTVLMLLVVTRVSGIYLGGVFALATAVGQQFQSLGMYEVRTYQATDVRHRFSFGNYHATRLITVGLMSIGIVLYPILGNQPRDDLVLLILLAALRIMDAFEDVFLGELQRDGRLDLAGRAYFFRVLLVTVTFIVVLVVTRNLMTTAVVSLIASGLGVLFLVVLPSRSLFPIRPIFVVRPIRAILVACLPLFLAAFLAIYLSNAPKFAIATYMNNDVQGYFAILFMPAFTINLLSTMLFRPLLTRMALVWTRGDRVGFTRLMTRGLQGATLAFLVTFSVTFLIGVPLLNFMYAEDIAPYKAEMLVLVVGGAFNALSTILYYGLATMRRQHLVFVGYATAGGVVLALSAMLVARHGMMGASISYAVAMATLTVVFSVSYWWSLHRISDGGHKKRLIEG